MSLETPDSEGYDSRPEVRKALQDKSIPISERNPETLEAFKGRPVKLKTRFTSGMFYPDKLAELPAEAKLEIVKAWHAEAGEFTGVQIRLECPNVDELGLDAKTQAEIKSYLADQHFDAMYFEFAD